MNLPAIEKQILLDGLPVEQVKRFAAIVKIADDRVRFSNAAAHVETALSIGDIAREILLISYRINKLKNENEQTKHTGPRT